MERFASNSANFQPTRHAAQRLRERFYPELTEEQAFRRLARLARGARPLKIQKVVTR